MTWLAASGLSNPTHVVILLVVIAVWIGQGALAGRIASVKGRSFGLWLAAALIVGPIVILAALLLPRRRLLR
jgi:hypothetical protein